MLQLLPAESVLFIAAPSEYLGSVHSVFSFSPPWDSYLLKFFARMGGMCKYR